MKLETYLQRPLSGTHTEVEIESDWLDFCLLSLPSGLLSVMDPTLFEGVVVDLPAGEYALRVKVMDWGDDRRVSRLQVIAAFDGHLGAELGTIGVDFGQIGVGDWGACKRAAEVLDETGSAAVIAAMDAEGLYGVIPWGTTEETRMPFVQCGFGDGRYPIFECIGAIGRVGVEVVFIGQEMALGVDDE